MNKTIDLTKTLGINYIDLEFDTENEWKDDIEESRFLMLNYEGFDVLMEALGEIGLNENGINYVIVDEDNQNNAFITLTMYNLEYRGIWFTEDYVEIHFHTL